MGEAVSQASCANTGLSSACGSNEHEHQWESGETARASDAPVQTQDRPDSAKSLCACSARSLPSVVRPDDPPPAPFPWPMASSRAAAAPVAKFTKLRCQDKIMQIDPDDRSIKAVIPQRHFCAAVRVYLDSIRPFFNFLPQVKSTGGLKLSKGKRGKGPSTMPFTLGAEAEMSLDKGGSRAWREGWLHLIYPRICERNGESDSLTGEIQVTFGGGETGLGECTASLHFEFQCAFEDVVPPGIFHDQDHDVIVALLLRERARLQDIDVDYVDTIVREALGDTLSPVARGRITKSWIDYFRANLMRKKLDSPSEGNTVESDEDGSSVSASKSTLR